jgi:pimeloyl-ACP methyl ester carboxylesterase
MTTGYLEIDGSKLYYEIEGEGSPVVLIHDGLVDCQVWEEQFQVFTRSYKVMRYDRRGYGRSERPWDDYSNVEDLLVLLQYLDIERATLMGVSAGGMVAIGFTLAHPDMVDALVLVGPALGGFDPSDHVRQRGEAATRPLVEDDDVDETIKNWVNDPYLIAPQNAAARQRLRELLTANPHNLYDPHWHSFAEPGEPAIGRLSEIRARTLLVVGEADIPDNHAAAGALQAGISGSKRVVLPGAGHLANLEQPESFNQTVLDYLA